MPPSALQLLMDWLAALMAAVSSFKWVSLGIAHLILVYSLLLVGLTMVRRG